MNLLIALKLLSLSILSIFAIPGTTVFGSSDLGVFVTSSTGNVKLDMKATEAREVADFTVKPESVVQIRQGENLNVFTVPPDRVDKVKITDSAGVRNELVPLGNNQYSLVGVNAGVYVLDAIVDPPDSSERAAYETIIVILKPGEPVQNVQNIIQTIQKVKVVTQIDIDFDDDSDECSSKIGSAGLKYPQDKRTECEKRDYDECEKKGFKTSGGFCDNIYELFWDDDCFGFNNAKECSTWHNDGREKFCEEFPNDKRCDKDPEVPICDENTPENTLCRDEGDFDSCEEGFVDSGNGCEPIDCEANPDHADCEPKDSPDVCPPKCGPNPEPIIPETEKDDFNPEYVPEPIINEDPIEVDETDTEESEEEGAEEETETDSDSNESDSDEGTNSGVN